jgi:hypothetical protein
VRRLHEGSSRTGLPLLAVHGASIRGLSRSAGWADQIGQVAILRHDHVCHTLVSVEPWLPTSGSGRPTADFANHTFAFFTSQVETRLGARLDYVVADQYGRVNGRFHQHALLAGVGLERYPRREMAEWLRSHAGYSRIVPFEHGAAYYISRYIGRDIQHANWDLRIGEQKPAGNETSKHAGVVVVASVELPKALFHQTMFRRKR